MTEIIDIKSKLRWLLFNQINNLFPNLNVDRNAAIRDFVCDKDRLEGLLAQTNKMASPVRKLIDLFLMSFPWAKVLDELKEINVLDVGCGTGNYGERLLSWTNNRINSYFGVDITENNNWADLKQKYHNFNFLRLSDDNWLRCIPEKTNLLISISALEHFEKDFSFFGQVEDYALSSNRDIIQLHLIPSAVCMYLYPWHGIRQYTPRKISKIIQIFKESYAVVFRLGGRQCYKVHLKYIADFRLRWLKKSKDSRSRNPDEYVERVNKAIMEDMSFSQYPPIFYALLIHSYWRSRLF